VGVNHEKNNGLAAGRGHRTLPHLLAKVNYSCEAAIRLKEAPEISSIAAVYYLTPLLAPRPIIDSSSSHTGQGKMSWVIDNRIANGIALGGSAMAIIMWLAPVRDIWTAEYSVFRTRSTENVATGFGFVAGCFNCILWNMFASTRLDLMLVPFIVNSAGFLLNLSFSLCYYCYGDSKARRETCNQLMLMLFVTALAIIFWVVQQSNDVVG
jgi:hypothetical protein